MKKRIKNLKVMSLDIGCYHLMKRRERGKVISSMIENRNPDVILLQEMTPLIKKVLIEERREYDLYEKMEKETGNKIFVKKDLPVTSYHSYPLKSLIKEKSCSMITLGLEQDISIFNVFLDPYLKKSRFMELKELYQILDSYFDEDFKIIAGNFQMNMKSYLMDFMKLEKMQNGTNHLRSSRIGKIEDATNHIFLPKECSSFTSTKISASKDRIEASPYYALEVNLSLKKVIK